MIVVAGGCQRNTVTQAGNVRRWAGHERVIHAAWMASAVYDIPRRGLSFTGLTG